MTPSLEDKLDRYLDALRAPQGPPAEPRYAEEIPEGRPRLSLVIACLIMAVAGWALERWWLFRPRVLAGSAQAPTQALSVSVDLTLLQPPGYAPETRNLPGPAGGSHRDGTESIDPALLSVTALKVISSPPKFLAEVPPLDTAGRASDLSSLSQLVPSTYTLDRSLPVQAGGNGAPRGDGRGFGRRHGDGVGSGSGGGGSGSGGGGAAASARPVQLDDLEIRQRGVPNYAMTDGEVIPEGTLVVVRLWIARDGMPFDISVVQGPECLIPETLRATRLWRFRIPSHLLDRAPIPVTIRYHYYRMGIKRG